MKVVCVMPPRAKLSRYSLRGYSGVRGENNRRAKLKDEDIPLIRSLIDERERMKQEKAELQERIKKIDSELKGLSNGAIGEKFGVGHRAVCYIGQGYVWGHIK